MNYRWPLNTNNFTLRDRLKICSFFLKSKNRWTQDNYVLDFEKKIAEFTGNKHAVFVSSGSTANTILAMFLRDHTRDDRKQVIFPANTWTTSISPFIREGFEPKFIDITLENLGLDLKQLEVYLEFQEKNVAAVFVTSLLGITPDIAKLAALSKKYPNIKFWMDNCEATFSQYLGDNISGCGFTSTTSTYFGHQLQSVEGGFILTNDSHIFEYALLARNHGMSRSTTNRMYDNPDCRVDKRFDFYILGNNFRNTNIHAFIGLLDAERILDNIHKRSALYQVFCEEINQEDYLTFPDEIMFAIPIIKKNPNKVSIAQKFCEENGIETRPIIAGNLLRQTCYKRYGSYTHYPISEYVNNNGFYVGLHTGLTENDVTWLAQNI